MRLHACMSQEGAVTARRTAMRLHACMSQEGAATARRTAMRLHACTALVPCQQDLNYAPADRL